MSIFKKLVFILIFSVISCEDTDRSITVPKEDTIKNIPPNIYKVTEYKYDSLTKIPRFFQELAKNHTLDYLKKDSIKYYDFAYTYDVNSKDTLNISKYFTIKILHDLLSSKSAYDCSKGEILSIPYMWHWVEPNPRYDIRFITNKKLLKDTKPPLSFSKYNSYADIDRTPFIYLSDLVSPNLKYYSNDCGEFSTFGWCSEREMAFLALTKILGYDGKMLADSGHSWTEFIVPMKLNNEEMINLILTVDNTFYSFTWRFITNEEIPAWREYLGDDKLAGWYNMKAKSSKELSRIKNYNISQKAMNRIEGKLVDYLQQTINEKRF